MDRNDIDEVARAIVALNVWKKASKYNWALVSELFDKPLIAAINPTPNGPILARLLLFNGFNAHRDFLIFQQNRDLSFALSLIDFDHYEIIGLRDGSAEIYDYRPGYVPVRPDDETRTRLAPAVYECYGTLLRIDENPDLPTMYMKEQALFSRKEGLDGKWHDAPLHPPKLDGIAWTERISLDRAKCTQAARFDMETDGTWEVDFIQIPMYRTDDTQSRTLFLFAAIDAKTGERRLWQKMAVDPKFPRNGTLESLQVLWESLAAHLLDAIIRYGKVPGSVCIRSQRMMRMLRPLGMQLPFKLVLHREMPRLTATVNHAILEHTI